MITRKWTLILAFLLLLALACGSGGNSQSGSNRQEREPEEAEQEAVAEEPEEAPAEEAPAAYALGEDIQVGPARWKLLEAQDIGKELKSDNQFIESKSTPGRFVRVKLEIENQGTEAATYSGIELIDGKNRTFQPYQERFFFIEEAEQCSIAQLNPNLPKTCVEIFELPADASGLKAKLGDLQIFGTDEAMVDLGL